MASLSRDLWYALRLMRKRPGVTVTAVLTLALGLGANAAIFGVVNGVLLKPLPYPSSDRLVHVAIAANTGFGERTSLPLTDFLAWQTTNRSCQSVAVYASDHVAVSVAGQADQATSASVSAAFFETLGIQPALGRFWKTGDDRPGAPLTVVVSHAFWARRLGSQADAVGRSFLIEGQPHEVIGVAPAGFAFPAPDLDLWYIERLNPPSRRGPYYLNGIGRLRAGATIQQAHDDLVRAESEVYSRFPGPERTRYLVEPLGSVLTGDARPALLLLAAAALLVLTIAVGNVANLLLIGAAERERELAVRAALGAGRRRLVVQLFVEGTVLAGAGAVAAWFVATWATRLLVAASPANLPRLDEIQMDAHVVAWMIATAIASAMIFGLVPAVHLSERGLLHAAQVTATGRPAARRFRNGLVVGEIALALTVAVMAGLLAKSLARLQQVKVGVTAERVLTASITLPVARYPSDRVGPFLADLLQRLEAIPGVVAAATTNSVPPDGLSMTDNFVVEDRLPPAGRAAPVGPLLIVSPAYLRTLGISLVRGRWFDEFDKASSTSVVVISETMAREYFPGLDPVGRRLKNTFDVRSDTPWRTVVGIVADVKYGGLAEAATPAFYMPQQQVPWRDTYVAVRTTSDPAVVLGNTRAVLRALDPDLPLGNVRTLDELLRRSAAPARFRTGLMAMFGGLGVVLAAVGIYGVITFSVTQRTRELGVRLALGASPRDVLRMVAKETALLAALGTAVGLVFALVAGRFMSAVLFAVNPADAVILAGSSFVLVVVALAAGLLPARRAAAIDPIVALRTE